MTAGNELWRQVWELCKLAQEWRARRAAYLELRRLSGTWHSAPGEREARSLLVEAEARLALATKKLPPLPPPVGGSAPTGGSPSAAAGTGG